MVGSTPRGVWTTIRRARLIRVLLVYLGASFAVLEAVDILTEQVGLPDWVVPGALVLLLLGLPIIVATALVQSAPGAPSAPSAPSVPATPVTPAPATESELASPGPPQTPASAAQVAAVAKHWLTWRKAILGGVLAFALLGVATAGYMTMRVLGIGPVGSLVAAGVLDPRERIILADFENNTSDSLLAVVVTEAFRIDLAQSPLIRVAEPRYVTQVLKRMEQEPDVALDRELAVEVAIREGLKAVIAGEVGTVGTSFVVSAELILAESGEALAGFRETADDLASIVGAIDRLSKKLRKRVGESLKTIRSNEPLEKVTTGSLDALRKYSQARRAIYVEGDVAKGLALAEEAIALDSVFAGAYNLIGITLMNRREERSRAVEALTTAFELRDRLTDRERYMTLGIYYDDVTDESEKAITAYSSLLDLYPDHGAALNNLANLYTALRDYARAEELYRRALTALDSGNVVPYTNTILSQVAQGKFDEAQVTLERLGEKFPENPAAQVYSSNLASARGDYEAAEQHAERLREERKGSLFWRATTSNALANLARVRGRLAESERHYRDAMAANEERGQVAGYLGGALNLAAVDAWVRGAPEPALSRVEAALERYPFSRIEPLDRPYLFLALVYALADRPELARATLAEYEAAIEPELRRGAEGFRHLALGRVAEAEGRPREAIEQFRLFHEDGACAVCGLPDLAGAYDLAGEPDSALAIYERFITTPWLWRVFTDSHWLPVAYERLGSLYEERGNPHKAVYYYGRLVELWKDADPELQPRVEAARRAIRALSPDQ